MRIGISGWSNVSPSEPSILEPSAAVIGLKSAVATPVILVDLRSVKDRCGLVSEPSSLRLTASLFVSTSSLYFGYTPLGS